MQSINPATGKEIRQYPSEDIAGVEAKLTALQFAFLTWKDFTIAKRIEVILKVADLLEKNKSEYAMVITSEMGKVKKEAILEIEKCALTCKYYAENAKSFLANKTIRTESSNSFVTYSPLGIILGIMPWNFPFWQVFRFAVPTLLAGNVIMLKHASSVPGCSLTIESIFTEATADLNLEIFKAVLLDSKHIEKVICEPLVQAVTLTGSVAAGKSVASVAGGQIKKTVLELGGSDPYIILADANLNQAAAVCAKARLMNCGQSCIAAKRFIAIHEVYDEFAYLLVEEFNKLKVGDPNSDTTDIGPLASQQILDTIAAQVQTSIAGGAKCILGGEPIPGPGFYYQPTILTNTPINTPAGCEEMFGPVAALFRVASEQEAIDLANATQFGLGAAIFTRDIARGTEIAEKYLNAGNVAINTNVASDPRLPFGGIKQSGYGRELSEFGIHEFVNIKSIKID